MPWAFLFHGTCAGAGGGPVGAEAERGPLGCSDLIWTFGVVLKAAS